MQLAEKITKPSKQRKMLCEAPDHIRHRLFAAHLSPELRASHLVKTFPIRSGDTIRIMRGDHRGFEGKVTRIGKRKYRIYVEGLTREKVDGSTIFVPIHPSKVMITNLNLDDKWRKKILGRKKVMQVKLKEAERKTKEKQKVQPEHIVEAVEAKPPVAEKKIKEQIKKEGLLPEKKPLKKALAPEKPRRKKAVKTKRKATKKSAARETRIESGEREKKKKSAQSEKKKPKRRAAKNTVRGE